MKDAVLISDFVGEWTLRNGMRASVDKWLPEQSVFSGAVIMNAVRGVPLYWDARGNEISDDRGFDLAERVRPLA